ncbi:DegT/DnrJ/EryC1/StrS family aminotransferase, partial [Streptomyces sp. NPDC001139]
LVQLGKLDAMIARRRELAARYAALLHDAPATRTRQHGPRPSGGPLPRSRGARAVARRPTPVVRTR